MANRKYKNIVQARKAKARINNAYKKRAQVAFTLRYHKVNDASVIEKIQSVPNKIDYVRQLILRDIDKEGN